MLALPCCRACSSMVFCNFLLANRIGKVALRQSVFEDFFFAFSSLSISFLNSI